jgi:RNA recognition motif-containing protein
VLLTDLPPGAAADEGELGDAVAAAGAVTRLTLGRHRASGLASGWAVVEFESEEGAAEAVERLGGATLLGATVAAAPALGRRGGRGRRG